MPPDDQISHAQAVIAHFRKRSWERYRIHYHEGDYQNINNKIKNGEYILEKENKDSITVRVIYKNRHLRCVYSYKLNRLMTTLHIKIKNIEQELRHMINNIEKIGDEIIFSKRNFQVRVNKKLNYVIFNSFTEDKKNKRTYTQIGRWGYPDNFKKIDEILMCVNNRINPKRIITRQFIENRNKTVHDLINTMQLDLNRNLQRKINIFFNSKKTPRPIPQFNFGMTLIDGELYDKRIV